MTPSQQLLAEFLGAAFLLAAVTGSGVMGEDLAHGNDALALLANTLATGAILFVLITIMAPISGAHFNPAVTFVFWLRGEIATRTSLGYAMAQMAGAIVGVFLAHAMFDLPILQHSTKARGSLALCVSEMVATFGLVLVILLTVRVKPAAVAGAVGLYITAAYWFTASTSFANPAVTIARTFSDTFTGIRIADAPGFIAMQFLGAAGALWISRALLSAEGARSLMTDAAAPRNEPPRA